jgi:hypothetical protein
MIDVHAIYRRTNLWYLVRDWLEANPREYWYVWQYNTSFYLRYFHPMPNQRITHKINDDYVITALIRPLKDVRINAADPNFFHKIKLLMMESETYVIERARRNPDGIW